MGAKLQQHLPFTVLKLAADANAKSARSDLVATAPTVYGIETNENILSLPIALSVATAPTVYGIETTLFQ